MQYLSFVALLFLLQLKHLNATSVLTRSAADVSEGEGETWDEASLSLSLSLSLSSLLSLTGKWHSCESSHPTVRTTGAAYTEADFVQQLGL